MSTKPRPHPRGVQYRKKKPRSIQVAPARRSRRSQESKEDDEDEEGGRKIVDDFDEAFDDDDEDYGSVCCGWSRLDDNPVRKLYNKAWADFASDIPICWMQTVCAKDEATNVRTCIARSSGPRSFRP